MANKIFKLSNGEQVNATELEQQIEKVCHYVKYAVVTGEGKDYPVVLIFPNKNLLAHPDYEVSPDEGCFCPRNPGELGRCLTGCLHLVNNSMGPNCTKIKVATVLDIDDAKIYGGIDYDLVEKYRGHLKNMYGGKVPVEEEVYIIKLEQ